MKELFEVSEKTTGPTSSLGSGDTKEKKKKFCRGPQEVRWERGGVRKEGLQKQREEGDAQSERQSEQA